VATGKNSKAAAPTRTPKSSAAAKTAGAAGGKQLGLRAAATPGGTATGKRTGRRTGRPSGRPTGKPSGTPSAKATDGVDGPMVPAWRAGDVVLGRVATGARVAGALAVLAALGLAVRPFLPLGTVKGVGVGQTAGGLGLLGWLPAIAVLGGAGALTLSGRLTRFGMAAIGAAGAVSIGTLLRTLWLFGSDRTTVDLPVGGQALHSDEYAAGGGLILQLVIGCLLVLALLAVLFGWTSTVMDDGGGLDRRRPAFAALGLFGGVITAGAFSMSASSSSIGIAQQAVTAQVGLQRVAGLILVGVIVCCCVLAPTLRPWLAAAGGWLGVAVMLVGQAIENLIAVHRSPDMHPNLGTVGQVFVPVLVLALAAAALLVRTPARQPAA
jgi:hypothetical protein